MDWQNLKMFGLTLGVTRDEMQKKVKEYLDSQNISESQKLFDENTYNTQIGDFFTKYDKDGNGQLTENELVGFDFSEEIVENVDKTESTEGTGTTQGTGTTEGTDSTGNVEGTGNTGSTDGTGNVENPEGTDPTTDKKLTKEEFLEWFKNDLPEKLKERFKDIDPEKLYDLLKDEEGLVKLADIEAKLEALTDDELGKIKLPAEPETPEIPEAPQAGGSGGVGGVGGGGGGGGPKVDPGGDKPVEDPNNGTNAPFNALDVTGANTPAEKVEKLEANKATARTNADGEIANEEKKMMDVLAAEIPPEVLEKYETASAQIDANIETQTTALADAQDSLTTAKTDKDVAEANRDAKKEEATSLKDAAGELRGKADGITVPSPKYDEKGNQTNSAEIRKAEADKASLYSQADTKDAEAAEAEAAAEEFQAQATELQTQIAALETQVNDINTAITDLQNEKNKLLDDMVKDATQAAKDAVTDYTKNVAQIRTNLATELGKVDAEISTQKIEQAKEEREKAEAAKAKESQEAKPSRFEELTNGLKDKTPTETETKNLPYPDYDKKETTETFKDGSTVKTIYDKDGNAVHFEFIDKNGKKETFDQHCRPSIIEEKIDGKPTTISFTYQPDVEVENADKTKTTRPSTILKDKITIADEKDGKKDIVVEKFDEQGRVVSEEKKTRDGANLTTDSKTETTHNPDGTKTTTETKLEGEKPASQTVIEYDKDGKEVSTTKTEGADNFDSSGNPTTATRTTGSGKDETKTEIEYNPADGGKTETTTTDSGVVVQTFDKDGNLTKEETKSADGKTTLSTTEFKEFDEKGKPKTATRTETADDGTTATTLITYDYEKGTRTEALVGGKTTTYNPDGSKTEKETTGTGAKAEIVTRTFDSEGNITHTKTTDVNDKTISETAHIYGKDEKGKPITKETTTQYEYDAEGNPRPKHVAVISTDGDEKVSSMIREVEYREDGKLAKTTTTITNGNPGKDEAPQTVVTVEYGKNIAGDRTETTTTYYESGENAKKKTEEVLYMSGKDFEGSTTTTEYDKDGKTTKTTVTEYAADGSSTVTETKYEKGKPCEPTVKKFDKDNNEITG